MPDGPDHPETWVFHMAMAFHGDPVNSLSYPERLALVKARAETMGEPARSAFLWIPPTTLVHNADISYWITQPWDNHGGRMTLAGDALVLFYQNASLNQNSNLCIALIPCLHIGDKG
jgi:hypothetical protein